MMKKKTNDMCARLAAFRMGVSSRSLFLQFFIRILKIELLETKHTKIEGKRKKTNYYSNLLHIYHLDEKEFC